ncbi:XkdF-like putative serine protease domain-containing protein [Phyllobacterium leguminum]|uniref:ParB-like nuclease family protein n=1 Tax=Phyllobacterium leguminum TaxID=314237 RepID=A0A318T3Z3_9HYPH|nr:XkdF-like putative serine protease domain-containing protein [Phyllobacterium leguminum]PYE89593.1 ParB-like nuclease family protein [Phyllobacterium leguminum]
MSQPSASAVHVDGVDWRESKKKPKDATKTAAGRSLEPLDGERSKTPFAYEGNVLGMLREDQVPRFFGTLTNSDKLETQTLKLADLTAMQNRVDTAKVNAIAGNGAAGGKLPVVVKINGRLWIADGHHRLTAAWLNGDEEAEVRFKDLEPETNVMKAEIVKADDEQRMAYGWASVISEGGKPVIDTQGDVIDASELVKSTTEFMADARVAKAMHEGGQVGEVLHSFPLTAELAKSLGISSDREGWIVGVKVHDDGIWKRVKSGELRAFSIGGSGTRIPMTE